MTNHFIPTKHSRHFSAKTRSMGKSQKATDQRNSTGPSQGPVHKMVPCALLFCCVCWCSQFPRQSQTDNWGGVMMNRDRVSMMLYPSSGAKAPLSHPWGCSLHCPLFELNVQIHYAETEFLNAEEWHQPANFFFQGYTHWWFCLCYMGRTKWF